MKYLHIVYLYKLVTHSVESVGKNYSKQNAQIIDAQNVIPDHQFGFRKKHSTIEQCNRVYSIARDALKKRSIALQSSLTLAKLLIKFGIQDFSIS